jgi:Caspase domain
MSLTRREWLKQAGLLSAGFWLGNRAMHSPQALAQTLTQTLAHSTPRKLALLVGIDRYPKSVSALKGCVTDVELLAELLIHRFGFAAADVMTLTDEAATRSNIESSFISHLSEQARPGDIAVFHFSGYGCLVRTRLTTESGAIAGKLGEQQALVPVDAWIPNAVAGAPPVFNGIYEDTLFLLLRSLLTDRVTTILDVGLQPSLALRCRSLRERALPIAELESPSTAELALQERLLQQTQLTRDQVQVQRQAGQLPGLVLTAATMAQPAALEADWPEFSAGLLSYGLTQQLWGCETANITIQFNRLSNRMAQQIGAIPQPMIKGQNFSALPWALGSFAMPQTVGFIASTNRSGQTSKVWLGGLRAELLELYQPQSYFRAVRASVAPAMTSSDAGMPEVLDTAMVTIAPSTATTLVQLKSRRGWTAIAERRLGPPLVEGAFLAEAIRVLPKNIALKLALGSDLNRIERVDATSFISMENRSLQVVGDTRPADYVFTKISTAKTSTAKTSPPSSVALDSIQGGSQSSNSYGLAYLSGMLLPNTAITRSGVVKLALQRLRPTFDTLLALKLLELSVNDAAMLHISATLEQAEDNQPLIRLQTPGGPEIPFIEGQSETLVSKADKSAKILSIPNGTAIQYRINNWNRFPVYVWLVGVNSSTTLFSSYAKESTAQSDSPPILRPLAVQPGTSVTLPTATQVWKTSNMIGLNQAFLIMTRQPLAQTLAMQTTMLKSNLPSAIAGFIPLPDPLPVIQKLFEDLHQASLPMAEPLGIAPQNAWVLDIDAWASLQFVYRTV